MTPSSEQQRQILQAIDAGERVTGDRANWAVLNGLARQGEDGDIDLTPEGAEVLKRMAPPGA